MPEICFILKFFESHDSVTFDMIQQALLNEEFVIDVKKKTTKILKSLEENRLIEKIPKTTIGSFISSSSEYVITKKGKEFCDQTDNI